MGDLSKHFSRSEFQCKHCTKFINVPALIALLEDAREHFGRSITINSGTRCQEHNKVVGGEDHSYHLTGQAADIVVEGISPDAVWHFFKNTMNHGGLGRYSTWTHVDVRPTKQLIEWDRRTKT